MRLKSICFAIMIATTANAEERRDRSQDARKSEFLHAIEASEMHLPGILHITPHEMREEREIRRFPSYGIYCFLDRTTSLYITPTYSLGVEEGETLVRKDIGVGPIPPDQLALTVIEDEPWARTFHNQSLQFGVYFRVPPVIRVGIYRARFGINVGYDIERAGVVYLRLHIDH